MTVEDRLQHVLQSEAEWVDADTQWPDVERNLAARRRTRRLRQAALSTVAAAAMVAGVLAVVASDDRESGLRVVPPATQPTLAPSTTVVPTTAAAPATVAMPATLVVQRPDGEVAELSSTDGRQIRVLLPGRPGSSSFISGSVSMPDARDVVYTTIGPSETVEEPRMLRIDLATGARRDIGVGYVPAVSPDGKHLAYATMSDRPEPTGADRLVVRDLRTGAERTWDAAPPGPDMMPTIVGRLSWAADSHHLAVEQGWENAIDVITFDTAQAELRPHQVAQGTSIYSHPVYLGEEGSLVVRANDDDDYGSPTPDAIVTVEPTTGRVLDRLISSIHGQPLGSDTSGRHLLYRRFTEVGDKDELLRWTDGSSVKLADRIVAADW